MIIESCHLVNYYIWFLYFRQKSAPSSPMVMRAFSRLGSSISARWDKSFKRQESKENSSLLFVTGEQDELKRWQSDINCGKYKIQLIIFTF